LSGRPPPPPWEAGSARGGRLDLLGVEELAADLDLRRGGAGDGRGAAIACGVGACCRRGSGCRGPLPPGNGPAAAVAVPLDHARPATS